jgi:hypothetical protein
MIGADDARWQHVVRANDGATTTSLAAQSPWAPSQLLPALVESVGIHEGSGRTAKRFFPTVQRTMQCRLCLCASGEGESDRKSTRERRGKYRTDY